METVNVSSIRHVNDTIHEQQMVMVYDTLREVTTITIQISTEGDTIRTDCITDRTHGTIQQSITQRKITHNENLIRDSLSTTDSIVNNIISQSTTFESRTRNFKSILVWMFLLVIALIIFVIVIRRIFRV